MRRDVRLPQWVNWVFRRLYCKEDLLERTGDLYEAYCEIFQDYGHGQSWFWIVGQVGRLALLKFFIAIGWRVRMVAHYWKMGLKQVKRHRVYSVLNMTGLVVGLTCSMLLFLYVRFEWSFDRYHVNANRLYRIIRQDPDFRWMGSDLWNGVSGKVKPVLQEHCPQIKSACRLMHRKRVITSGERRFVEERFFFVDSEFLNMFTFPLVRGNIKTALHRPMSLVLTERMAQKYFGREEALGKTLMINGDAYEVTGVLKKVPQNSHFTFDFLASFSTLFTTNVESNETIEKWGWNNFSTYVQLHPQVNAQGFQKEMSDLLNRIDGRGRGEKYRLQRLTDIHLHSQVNEEIEPNGDVQTVYALIAIAVFLLVIAGFNFANLSMAMTFHRVKEVGVRKVLGAGRRQMLWHLLGESMLQSFIGFLLSVGGVLGSLPFLRSLLGVEVSGFEGALAVFASFLFIAILIGLLAGLYPALGLSRVCPMQTFKGNISLGGRRTPIRNGLVAIQFVLSMAMIASTLVVYRQLNYIREKKLGYDKAQVVTMPVHGSALRKNYQAFKEQLLQNPLILGVTSSSRLPDRIDEGGSSARWKGWDEENPGVFYMLFVDYDFLEFYNLSLIQGRTFSEENGTDRTLGYLLNQTAVDAIGWKDPIGQGFRMWSDEMGSVIGVVKPFHYQSLRDPIEPLVIKLFRSAWDRRFISIRVQGDQIPAALKALESTWNRFSGGYPFEFSFLDDRLESLYRADQRLGSLFGLFAGVAIFIASLGLYGLGAFVAEKRVREIGVRKVLGASVLNIFMLLTRSYFKWILLAAGVGLPMSWLFMRDWLRQFAYRVSGLQAVYALAVLLTLGIALIAVGQKVLRAAVSNPIHALKCE